VEIQCSFIELNILQKVSERFPLGRISLWLKAAEFLTKIVKKGCPQSGFEPGAFQKAKKVRFFV
jgi:hypothetical protein